MFFLIADTHFLHNNIIKYCGRPYHYNELLEENMRKTLTRDDVLIHLGDICLGRDAYVHARYINPLPCKKILIRGNHDKQSSKWYLEHGWDVVFEKTMYLLTKYGNVILSHKPIWPIPKFYRYNIHGHLHNKKPRTWRCLLLKMANWFVGKRHILVSVEDLNYRPVALDNLIGQHWNKADQMIFTPKGTSLPFK